MARPPRKGVGVLPIHLGPEQWPRSELANKSPITQSHFPGSERTFGFGPKGGGKNVVLLVLVNGERPRSASILDVRPLARHRLWKRIRSSSHYQRQRNIPYRRFTYGQAASFHALQTVWRQTVLRKDCGGAVFACSPADYNRCQQLPP